MSDTDFLYVASLEKKLEALEEENNRLKELLKNAVEILDQIAKSNSDIVQFLSIIEEQSEAITEDNQLTKINSFTRRSFSADEVYVFDVILCDNEIDTDSERFSHEALLSLKELFVGKTGIFDHNPKSENQTARIFDTELIKDDSRKTSYGQPYEYLKASVYMVRTEANKDLIAEIDGGIKKEVSISCSAGEKVCSVCGCDKNKKGCAHVKGKTYNGKLCHNILGGVSDAYEWSFVAVPAQKRATDVQPVKHGYWEEIADYGGWGDTHYRCSVCGEEWYLEDGKPKDNNMNFCPRCGARMDLNSRKE